MIGIVIFCCPIFVRLNLKVSIVVFFFIFRMYYYLLGGSQQKSGGVGNAHFNMAARGVAGRKCDR